MIRIDAECGREWRVERRWEMRRSRGKHWGSALRKGDQGKVGTEVSSFIALGSQLRLGSSFHGLLTTCCFRQRLHVDKCV
jgi:hypothetical protein